MTQLNHKILLDESASITLDLLNESRKGAPGSAKAKAQEAYSDIRKAGWNDTIWGGSQVKKKKGAKDPRKAAYARVVLRHRLADFKKKKLAKKLPIANDGKPSGTDEIGKHDASWSPNEQNEK